MMKFAPLFSILLLAACQPAIAEPTIGVTVIPIASSTPGITGERQQLKGYFSFITPEAFVAELEDDSVFISDEAEEIFISLAIIGAGEERTAQALLDDIFESFDGVEILPTLDTQVGGLAGHENDFSGVLSGTVVSGNYVVVVLENGVSFMAFGMGNVEQDNDAWEAYGRLNFAQLLETVEILFGTY